VTPWLLGSVDPRETGVKLRKTFCEAALAIAFLSGAIVTASANKGFACRWAQGSAPRVFAAQTRLTATESAALSGWNEAKTGGWLVAAALSLLVLSAAAGASRELIAWWPLHTDLLDRISGIKLASIEEPEFADGAMAFDGESQYLSAGKHDCLGIGRSDFTLEATFKMNSFPGNLGFIIGKDDKMPGGHYYLAVESNGGIAVRFTDCGKDRPRLWVDESASPIEPAQWYHVVAAFDRHDSARVYLNGRQVGHEDISMYAGVETIGPFQVGMLWDQYFPGLISDVRIYRRALSLSEAAKRFVAAVAQRGEVFARTDPAPTPVGQTRVICKQPGRYVAWPTIARKDSELFVVFSGDRDAHVSPDGKIQIIRSSDSGATWTDPVTVFDSPLNDSGGAGILLTKKGTLLVSWVSQFADCDSIDPHGRRPEWRHALEKITREMRDKWCSAWALRSTDGARTWGEPIRMETYTPHGPIQLADGRLLYMGGGYKKTAPEHSIYGAHESHDDGKTWRPIGQVSMPEEMLREKRRMLSEPHVVETESGKLVALFRTKFNCAKDRFLYQSESADGGRTWSIPADTGVSGLPPHLIRLSNGWLLASYGRRRPPFGQRACISRDEGRTWDTADEIVVSVAPCDDLGYPASVQLADGSIVTVFYQIDKPGEKPSVMATHWRLPGIA